MSSMRRRRIACGCAEPTSAGTCSISAITDPWTFSAPMNVGYRALNSGRGRTGLGRKSQFAVSSSSRWPNIVADPLALLRASPPSNVKFRGTTDSRLKNWPTSGIGARRPSTRKSDRPQPVFCSHSRGQLQGSLLAGTTCSRLTPTAAIRFWKTVSSPKGQGRTVSYEC